MPICQHLKPLEKCQECQPKKKPTLTQAVVDKVASTLVKAEKKIVEKLKGKKGKKP